MTTARHPYRRLRCLLVTYSAPLAVLVVSVVIHELRGIDFGLISRDQAQQFHAYPLVGAQSTLGGIAWISGAVVGLFTVRMLRRSGVGRREHVRFLGTLSVFVLIMGLDDVFMFHDELGPRYLNIDERPVLALYGLTVIGIAIRFHRTIARLEPGLLALGVALLAGSILVDHFQEQLDASPYRIFLEDGFKFLGIVGLSGYLVRQSWHLLGPALERSPWTSRPRLGGTAEKALN